MADTETVAGSLPAERASVWEDFIDIFYAPSLVFARRARGSFWIPFFVVTLTIGALFYLNSGVLQPVMEGEFNRAMAAAMRTNPRLTPEMADRFRQTGVRLAQVAGFLIVPVAIFFTGSAVWLIGKLFESKQTYGAALVVAAYAWVPKIIEAVLNGLQGLFLDPFQFNGRFRLTPRHRTILRSGYRIARLPGVYRPHRRLHDLGDGSAGDRFVGDWRHQPLARRVCGAAHLGRRRAADSVPGLPRAIRETVGFPRISSGTPAA